jgi:hypothetical protein
LIGNRGKSVENFRNWWRVDIGYSDQLSKVKLDGIKAYSGSGGKVNFQYHDRRGLSRRLAIAMLGQVFSKYFGFPRQFSLHQLLHIF